MNKTFKKMLSLLLVVLMVFFSVSAISFAIDEEIVEHSAVFTVDKKSETSTEVTFTVKFTSGDALSFDLDAVTALTVSEITVNTAVTGLSENETTVSYSNDSAIAGGTLVATYKCTKSSSTGIVKTDFTVNASNCFADDEQQVSITPEIANNIPEVHAHQYVDCFEDSDCENDGYSCKRCSVCLDEIEMQVIKATGHDWTDWATTKNASVSEAGVQRRDCKLCTEYEEKEIPKIVVPVEKIILMPEGKIVMSYKKTTQVYVNVLPDDSIYSANIVWSSSNKRVATVDENGLVTATGFGTAKIVAKTADGKVKEEKTVTVQFSIIQLFVYLFDLIFG